MQTYSVHGSKRLSYLLRHDKDYTFLPGGWRLISDLIENHSFTEEEIILYVSSDSKGRYELNDDKSMVRALYGHSVDIQQNLVPSLPPAILYHGTAEKYLESIMKEGLKPRSRNYVHLSESTDMAMQVGARHGSPEVLTVDVIAMVEDLFKFYKVQNGVWLVESVPPKYILDCITVPKKM